MERYAIAHTASRQALAWALLAWVLVTAGGLSLRDGPHDVVAETAYRMATGAGFMALAWFGALNIPFGLVRDFSLSQIVVTTLCLGIGGYGVRVAFSTLTLPPFLAATTLFLAGEAAIAGWLLRKARHQARLAAVRPLSEPTIRGSGAVVDSGPDGICVVRRNETGRNTPAERFEQRLIRHIERALEIEAISMAGTNASYWRFRLPDHSHVVEMSVIGPGYNTAARLRESERWLLRIREPKPCVFTDWIGRHFGQDGHGVSRNLGALKQTQFASSQLPDDNSFFDAAVPWAANAPPEHGDGPWTMRVLRLPASAFAEDDDDAPDAPPPKKPTLH